MFGVAKKVIMISHSWRFLPLTFHRYFADVIFWFSKFTFHQTKHWYSIFHNSDFPHLAELKCFAQLTVETDRRRPQQMLYFPSSCMCFRTLFFYDSFGWCMTKWYEKYVNPPPPWTACFQHVRGLAGKLGRQKGRSPTSSCSFHSLNYPL